MSVANRTIKIGTRGSALALTQTNMVRTALHAHHEGLQTEIVVIKTSGDWRPEQGETRLREEEGGKGQFAREIEQALLEGAIDCAVHSMKDMETALPPGLVIRHMLEREDPRDALLLHQRPGGQARTLDDLPQGATVGTASIRRQALLLRRRPDLKIVPFRGNVQTRIDKLRAGQVDVTLLALAGLRRLGLQEEADMILSPEDMLPAAGQGAVGIEARESDTQMLALLDPLSCRKTLLAVTAERAALAALDGSCHTPLGAWAQEDPEEPRALNMQLVIVSEDGAKSFAEEGSAQVSSVEEAEALGARLGHRLKERIPAGFAGLKS
ncbi:MAG: hydroxymethylbilane synthase [Alphaproteobacteria bacterium]